MVCPFVYAVMGHSWVKKDLIVNSRQIKVGNQAFSTLSDNFALKSDINCSTSDILNFWNEPSPTWTSIGTGRYLPQIIRQVLADVLRLFQIAQVFIYLIDHSFVQPATELIADQTQKIG